MINRCATLWAVALSGCMDLPFLIIIAAWLSVAMVGAWGVQRVSGASDLDATEGAAAEELDRLPGADRTADLRARLADALMLGGSLHDSSPFARQL